MLVDSRTENWFFHETIPTAVNIPYIYTKNLNILMNLKNIWRFFGVKSRWENMILQMQKQF